MLARFEGMIASVVGAQHAVAVGSGGAALRLACASLDLPDGSEIIASPFEVVAATRIARAMNAVIRYVDVDPETLALDLDAAEAAARLPICRFDDAALIGFEPEAGFADATLVATGFARAARRRGVRIVEGVSAIELLRDATGRVTGVRTDRPELGEGGVLCAPVVVSTQNIWSRDIERWTGITTPVVPERHRVFALDRPGYGDSPSTTAPRDP